MTFQDLGTDLGTSLVPWFIVFVGVLTAGLGYWFVRNLVGWFGMKLKGYREGEELYLDDQPAMVAKIGFLSTRFLIQNGGGIIQRTVSVSNTRLDMINVKRISLRLDKLSKLDKLINKSDG